MSFEQFKLLRRTGQLPLVPPVLPPPIGMSGSNEQHGKGAPQIMSFEEFKEMKRLLRSNNLDNSAPISKKSSRTVDKRGTKKSSKAKAVNSSMKKDSLGSKKMNSSKSSNKLQTIPKEVINTNQQQQKKENKLSNRWSRKTKKETVKKQKSLSISKEVNLPEEKKILNPIPEVIAELAPTATASSNGIDSVVDKEGSAKGDDNVKTAVLEDQSIQDTSTTLDIYSAMLNEAQPYLTTTCTKSMKKEEVPTKEELTKVVVKEERLPVVDSVDSMDDNNEREGVKDEMVELEVEKEVAPDLSMAVFDGNEEKNRIGFDSSSSNQKKVDDDVVGKDVTIPSLTETRKPLVRTLDFDDEVDIMEDQLLKMSEEKPKSESDNSKPGKKGRILHIRTKRKINKGGFKKTMKKILPSLSRSKPNKAEQLVTTEQGELITDVKIFVPSPNADGMPVSPSAMSIISVESIVVVSNDRGTIIDTTPVTSGSPPPRNLLYGAINYDFKNFDEQSDTHSDDAQPHTSIPILNVESPDEEEDSESICVEVIEQARISDNDNVATEVVAVVAPEENTKDIKEVGHNSEVTTDCDTKAMNLTHSESTSQKKAETEKVDESILTESNDISYLDEYHQALLASYIHDMDAEEDDDKDDAEEDVLGYLQAPDTTNSNQTSIVQSAIDNKADDNSLPGPINHVEAEEKEEDTIEEEKDDEDEPVITAKSQKSIKLSVETDTAPSPSASFSVVSKKSSESSMQKKKIPSPKSRTTLFPKSASKKCSNGLVKSRISDIQQRIDALSSSTASSFDNHGRGTGRYSYSHPLPSPTCSVSSATSSISSRMSSSSYIRTVPIGIAKTYSQNLDSPSGSVVGLGFGNSTLDIDNNQWQDERATTVSYAQKYMK